MLPSVASPIPRFDALAGNVSIYRPTRARIADAKDEPRLIVLCSWGWALRKYISKYTDGYQKLYPSSDILLVESEKADFVWRPRWQQRRRLAPAIEVIESILQSSTNDASGDTRSPILLVAMSDGGVNSAINIATALRQALPIRALVLDSCPNVTSYTRAYNAFSISFPTAGFLRLVASLAAHAFLMLLTLLHVVGSSSPFTYNRKALNSSQYIARSCPRVYIYSLSDKLTDPGIVSQHVDEAEGLGYPTSRVLFKYSAHCAHVMEDREQYWSAVKGVWDAASRDS